MTQCLGLIVALNPVIPQEPLRPRGGQKPAPVPTGSADGTPGRPAAGRRASIGRLGGSAGPPHATPKAGAGNKLGWDQTAFSTQ